MSDESAPEPAAVESAPVVAFLIQSVCECQATLHAELDASRLVLRGWAEHRGGEESAPANTVGDERTARFDVAWKCPLCGRNTLRTFHEGALVAVP